MRYLVTITHADGLVVPHRAELEGAIRLIASAGVDLYAAKAAVRAAAARTVTLALPGAELESLTVAAEPDAALVTPADRGALLAAGAAGPLSPRETVAQWARAVAAEPVTHPTARTPIGTPVRDTRDGMVGRLAGASSAALMLRNDADGKTYGVHPSELAILTDAQYLEARYALAAARAELEAEADGWGLDLHRGARVELAPHTDWWMRGARYGYVEGVHGARITVRIDGIGRAQTMHRTWARPVR